MQEFYPVEYVVYNRFDCIGMELLEDKVKDMRVVLPQFSGSSDFEDFKSQPRRKMDVLHWFVQKHDRVMGCTSSALVDEELDPMILGRDEWIYYSGSFFDYERRSSVSLKKIQNKLQRSMATLVTLMSLRRKP